MTYTGQGPGEIDPESNAARNIAALAEEFLAFAAAAPVNPLIERAA